MVNFNWVFKRTIILNYFRQISELEFQYQTELF